MSMRDEFVWPSDADRAESDELNRVCEYLEGVLDDRDRLLKSLSEMDDLFAAQREAPSMSRIASSKVRQLGGEVFGVVIRDKRGRFATITEMGFVTWLDEDKGGEYAAYLEGMNSHLKAELKAARAQPEPSSGVPEGYVLAPKSMNITQDDVGLIAMMTGWEDEDQSEAEGVLWFGLIEDDDGNRTHGLNISCSECMEEGAIQLVQFDDPVTVTVTATPTPEAGQSGGMPVARWNGYGSIENLNTYLLDNHWEQPVYLYIHPHTNQPGSGAGDGWISVGERWPDKTGHYCVALSDPDDIGWSTLVSWTALWNGDGFEDCDPVEDGQPVTHWMPMPQPPQQGGSDK